MKNKQKPIGSLIKLKPEYEERYVILHKHTFPGVIERLQKSHFRHYSIFLLDNVLFSYHIYDGSNYSRDVRKMQEDEITQEWWKLTDPMQEPFPGRRDEQWWSVMDLISHDRRKIGASQTGIRRCFMAGTDAASNNGMKELVDGVERSILLYYKGQFINHYSVFYGFNRICLYIEFKVEEVKNGVKKRGGKDSPVQISTEIDDILATPWKEMKEVFYTK